MPLPAWRALLFAALVDDPGDEEARAQLLEVVKSLVKNGAELPPEKALRDTQDILKKQFPDELPYVIDPFCGGGSTLVEAQRLGLKTQGSDLNPVPVLITRALTELGPKIYGQQPLHPLDEEPGFISTGEFGRVYGGYSGLLADVVHYGKVVRDAAWEKLKPHYPETTGERTAAWLWARTAYCPNPACGIETILATTWWLNQKTRDLAWLEPTVVDGRVVLTLFTGQTEGAPPPPPKARRGATFTCLGCGNPINEAHLTAQGKGPGLGLRMLAVVIDRNDNPSDKRKNKRTYRLPNDADIAAATVDLAGIDVPSGIVAADGGTRNRFGLDTLADQFTPRQLLALTVFADCVADLRPRLLEDGATEAWADAVVTTLGLAVGRLARYGSTQSQWRMRTTRYGKAESAFTGNNLPVMWDFAETFFDGGAVGDWTEACRSTASAYALTVPGDGTAIKADARSVRAPGPALVATDPPYFEAIGYADLSDYFYVWHRRALRKVHPDLYATIAAPKQGELTALPVHHGGSREKARNYFIEGFTETFRNLQESVADGLPMLVVYASKEQKGGSEEEGRWSSILTAIVAADLQITGTWPVLGTSGSRMVGIGANVVATYVVMVCRPRPAAAGTCSVADFNRALRRELRPAIHDLQAAGVLPVDLSQAAMGPGMQVYSRYRAVLDQAGKRVPVEQALRLINAALGEVLDEQEGELDPYSRFAVAWWERHGWNAAAFGEADQLARPQGISVDDVVRAGVVHYPKPGFVAALGSGELDRAWTTTSDSRPTAWEAVHHLADRLIDGGGATEAARLMGHLQTFRDPAQALVYRLHAIAARKGWTKDQERYNALIGSWSDLIALSATQKDGLF